MTTDEPTLMPTAPPSRRARWRWVALLVGLLLVLGAGAFFMLPKSAGLTAEEYIARAREFYLREDYRSAMIELKNALQINPDDSGARWLLARTHLSLGNGSAALKEIDRARRLGQTGLEVEKARVRALLLQRQYDEALAWLDAQSELDADSLLSKAQAEMGLGRFQAARESFQEVLKRSPDNAQARLGLARVALGLRETKEAEKQLDTSLEQNQEDSEAWMLKGELEMTRGNFTEAQKAFEQALAVTPDAPNVRLAVSRALLAQGETQAAEEHIDTVLEAYPHSPLGRYLKAVAALQRGDMETATAALREVLNVSPTHPPSLLMMGGIHYQNRELEQASELLQRLLSVTPGSAQGTKLLAAVYLRQGHADLAIAIMEPLLKTVPQDPQLLAMLGSAYMTQRKFARATEYLTEAATAAPDVAAIRTQLAVSHLASGETQVGVAELKSAVEIDPDFTRADFILALVALQQRRFDEALDISRRLSEREPENPVTYNLMAAAYEGKGETEKARELYEHALQIRPAYQTAKLNLARLDLKNEDKAGARARYNEVLQAQPQNYVALTSLARLALDDREVDEALRLLETARTANPRGLDARLLLSTLYRGLRQVDAALETAEEAAGIAPGQPRVLFVLGQAQLAANQSQAAIETFTRLAGLNPDVPEVFFNLGLAQIQAGQAAAAKTSLRRALELNPDFLSADLSLGALAIREDQLEEALKIAQGIKQRFPQRPEGYALEGDIRMRESDFRAATQQFETALQRSQATRLVIKLSAAQHADGDTALAQNTLVDWLEKHPDDLTAHLALADSYLQNDKLEMAQKHYERVLAIQPTNALALNNLAWIYHDSADDRALEVARRAYESVPERAEVIDTYGWMLVQNGDIQQGVALLDKAARKAPQLPAIRYHFAAGLAEAGERRKAREELEVILASGEDFGEREAAQTLLDKLNAEKILEVLE